MTSQKPFSSEADKGLAAALLQSSKVPMLLLDRELNVVDVSKSFLLAFSLPEDAAVGCMLADLGSGAWNVRQLLSLLALTAQDQAAVDAYELDLAEPGLPPRRLIVSAYKLDYGEAKAVRLVLTATDITAARSAEKLKDDLLREKHILLQELQHRVANSLQIIASVLLQSAKKVQSDETRGHLRDAHNRVMSIAALQKQLAATRVGDVELKPYFKALCASIGASMISNDRLQLTSVVDDSLVKADVSVSLGLIVTELVINALKHAFPGHEGIGSIHVDYRSAGAGWMLSVTDDGIGMPVDHASATPGLGTGIVSALARHLSGVVTVTDQAPGTRVVVRHEA
jgi:two-component system, sensor histidine kinase PdtaS